MVTARVTKETGCKLRMGVGHLQSVISSLQREGSHEKGSGQPSRAVPTGVLAMVQGCLSRTSRAAALSLIGKLATHPSLPRTENCLTLPLPCTLCVSDKERKEPTRACRGQGRICRPRTLDVRHRATMYLGRYLDLSGTPHRTAKWPLPNVTGVFVHTFRWRYEFATGLATVIISR